MKRSLWWSLSLLILATFTAGAPGQDLPKPQIPPPVEDVPPPPANVVAATVNGQPILEIAVFRALADDRRNHFASLRKDVLEHLIENILIDQYVAHLKIDVEAKVMNEKMTEIKSKLEKQGGLEKVLKSLYMTEAELRGELAALLRWERFVERQATDKTLQDFFVKNTIMFNGTQVRARHILLKTNANVSKEQATARLLQIKKWIEEEAGRELAKLPAASRDGNAYARIVEKVFADVAVKESSCPSKQNGGDLGMFLRIGKMVEPFARAAFQLKPFQMSDVVSTNFGCHLILVTDRKPGKEVRFEDANTNRLVREVYADRLRDAVIVAMKPNAKIVYSAQR